MKMETLAPSRLVSEAGGVWAFVSRSTRLHPVEIRAAIDEAFADLTERLARAAVRMEGAPRACYHYADRGRMGFDLGFPIGAAERDGAERAGLQTGATLSGAALTRLHEGPYDSLSRSYRLLAEDLNARGLKGAGAVWEVYLNDPLLNFSASGGALWRSVLAS